MNRWKRAGRKLPFPVALVAAFVVLNLSVATGYAAVPQIDDLLGNDTDVVDDRVDALPEDEVPAPVDVDEPLSLPERFLEWTGGALTTIGGGVADAVGAWDNLAVGIHNAIPESVRPAFYMDWGAWGAITAAYCDRIPGCWEDEPESG